MAVEGTWRDLRPDVAVVPSRRGGTCDWLTPFSGRRWPAAAAQARRPEVNGVCAGGPYLRRTPWKVRLLPCGYRVTVVVVSLLLFLPASLLLYFFIIE